MGRLTEIFDFFSRAPGPESRYTHIDVTEAMRRHRGTWLRDVARREAAEEAAEMHLVLFQGDQVLF